MQLATPLSAWVVLACASLAFSLEGVLSIPPSLFWDGADGAWSTFQIQVGSPPQTVRLLPGTSADAGNCIWVVLPEGCSINNAGVNDCANDRGYLFYRNESSTWSVQRLSNGGLYTLAIYEESQLGMAGNADFAFDTVRLGIGGQNLPTLKNQVIAGIATNDFWLGSLGLSPLAVNFSSIDNPIPSTMSTLKAQKYIGSISWAYTAGAIYKSPPVFGSLTLGGFDSMRLNSSSDNVTVPFGSDISRDLLIAVRSITYDSLGSTPLLADGIYAFIDSMVSAMYLPLSVCRAFERAFNLTWDSKSELYLLTAEQHSHLVAQNPVISITVGNTTDKEGSVASTVIKLPYSAFDLNITRPYVNQTTRYFPLKRAQNESQYTLGRVFLQEAYVIADYDRQRFTVAQAAFPQRQSNQKLQAILPPPSAENSTISFNPPSQKHASFSSGVIAGIVTGSIVALGLVALGLWMYARNRTRKSKLSHKGTIFSSYSSNKPDNPFTELASAPIAELAPTKPDGYVEVTESTVYEIGNYKHPRFELPVKGTTPQSRVTHYEMASQEPYLPELDTRNYTEVYELSTEHSVVRSKNGRRI